MPRRAQTLSLEEAALAAFNEHFDAAAVRAAAQLGRPPQTKQVGDAEKVRQWGITDSKVDRARLSAQLLTTGLPPELLDPQSPNQLAIAKAAPDLAPLYAQPVQDPELADILAGFAERPFRYGILSAIDDPEDQVKEAERLSRLHDQQTSAALEAALAEQSGSNPVNDYLDNVARSAAVPPLPTDEPPSSAGASVPVAPQPPSLQGGATATPAAPVMPDQSMTMGG